jgi:hypothetical protein
MTRPKEYRAFLPDFLTHMHKYGAWPKDKAIMSWLLNMKRPKDRTHLSALRQGDPAPEPYAIYLIELMLSGASDPRFVNSWQRLSSFLQARGFTALGTPRVRMDSVIAHTCTQITTDPPERKGRKEPVFDRLRRGLQDLANIPPTVYMRTAVGGPSAKASIEEAVLWIYLRLAQNCREDGFELEGDDAIRAAEEIIGVPLDQYVARAKEWSAACPWSVVFARSLGRRKGTNIMLPVTQGAYGEVRSGTRSSYAVMPDELVTPSRHILFEALAEDPALVRSPSDDLSGPMCRAIAVQHGALMRWNARQEDSRYHFLAPAATPGNIDRMAATGWKPTGNQGSSHGHPIWEKVIDMESGENLRPSEAFIVSWLSQHCDPEPQLCKK